MKAIFLFFSALNLAFFLWQSISAGDMKQSNKSLSIPANVKKLVLLGETVAAQRSNGGGSVPEESSPEEVIDAPRANRPNISVAICYALGPFEASPQAKPIADKLQDLGALTYIRKKKKRVASGYWVYIPQFDSWKEARKRVMELESQGMTDIFIMGRGRMKNAVSLGMFKNKAAADSRIEKLNKTGISPKVEVQYSLSEEFWIDIDIEHGKEKVVKSIETIARGLTVLELEKRKCN